MSKDEALKLTIETNEWLKSHLWVDSLAGEELDKVTNACKEALEAEQVCQAQEPFVWWRTSRDITDEYYTEYTEDGNKPIGNGWQPLYTHPAQSWQGLTDDEIEKIIENHDGIFWYVVCAIEQALKEKNT